MEALMKVVSFLMSHFDEIILALDALVAALIAVSLLIPNEQPQKAFRAIGDFLSKFSRKPKP